MKFLMSGVVIGGVVSCFLGVSASSIAQVVISCLKECDDKTGFCLPVNGVSTENDRKMSFKGLYEDTQKRQPVVVSMQRLHELFDVDKDPCERSDSTFANGKFGNHGKRCTITSKIRGGLIGTIEADVLVPEKLEADITGGQQLEFTFSNPRSAPRLFIDDEDLHHEWGGQIKRIYFGQSRSIFQTETGCIEYTY